MTKAQINQRGGVSLFIVIFSCLFITIVTVSFVSIMIRSQQQANDVDLSNSAYDSAMAGVEDAKRLAIVYRECKEANDTTSPKCSSAISGVESGECNSIQAGLNGSAADDEVPIKSSTGDTGSDALDQAYTCVKVEYYTDTYEGRTLDGQTRMIRLAGANGAAFNNVVVSWHKRPQGVTGNMTGRSDTMLPQKSAWGASPAILRTQIVQTDPSFTLTDFDATVAGESNSNTTYLYPFGTGAAATTVTPVSFAATDPRPTTTPKEPAAIACSNAAYTSGGYACKARITLPNPIGASTYPAGSDGPNARRNAYIILSGLYNAADYRIQLFNGATPVQLDGVQPRVDATGRANDLFRRVDARIEFENSSFNYPISAVDLNSGLCKAFAVTDNTATYNDGGCTP